MPSRKPLVRPRLVLNGVFVVGVLTLALHFIATAVYLLPLSPVGLAHGSRASAYVGTIFQQKWSLFAPDPPLRNLMLNVQCRRDEADDAPSAWLDTERPLIDRQRAFRLTPAARLRRVGRAAVFAVLSAKDPVVEALIESSQDDEGDAEFKAFVDALLTNRAEERTRNQVFLDRLAATHCRRLYGVDVGQARARVVFTDVPKYSTRNHEEAESNPQQIVFPWSSIDDHRALPLD